MSGSSERGNSIADAASDAIAALADAGAMLVTAESCTGGLIAGAVTAVPGASAVLHGGFVTYADAAKTGMLGIPAETIARHGAVSEAVARLMAEGARRLSGADIAVAVTGIAGPGGGSAEKPVGTVWFGLAGPDRTHAERVRFDGDRDAVRGATVVHALRLVCAFLRSDAA